MLTNSTFVPRHCTAVNGALKLQEVMSIINKERAKLSACSNIVYFSNIPTYEVMKDQASRILDNPIQCFCF